jgi:2-dehydropantoate 2-reductase
LKERDMRIAVVGAGGVGGAFGAALAHAGGDVTFIARGAHLKAMQEKGLRILSPRGDTLLQPAQATDDPAKVGVVDLVMFCVKLWDVESAGEAIKPMVGPNTAVMTFQNGIDAHERLLPILGPKAVMGGVAQISATIAEPGVIKQTGTFMRLVFGELDGSITPRGEAFLALCQKAGFDATLSDRILTELWLKFILLATNSGWTALTRRPMGELRDDPDIAPMMHMAVREVAALAAARGVPLPEGTPEKIIGGWKHMPPNMRASMALDLIRGNRIELPWLSGKVVAMGREFGVPTPIHAMIYAGLKPYIMGALEG